MKQHVRKIFVVFAGLIAAALTLHLVVNWLAPIELIKKLHGH